MSIPMGENTPTASTRQLEVLCKQHDGKPPLPTIESVLRDGADIFYHIPGTRRSAVFYLLSAGSIDCVVRCIELYTPPIDFTSVDHYLYRRTLLHMACAEHLSIEQTQKMISTIAQRVQSHPLDVIKWDQLDGNGLPFWACAAHYQKLSAVWPLIEEMPFFSDRLEPLSPGPVMWSTDWDALGQGQSCFLMSDVNIVHADEPTATFFRLISCTEFEPHDFVSCVRRGADLYFSPNDSTIGRASILHRLFRRGTGTLVKACLSALEHLVNPLLADPDTGKTALEMICYGHNKNDSEVSFMLTTVLQYMEEESISALRSNSKNVLETFLSTAAACRFLGVVIPVLLNRLPNLFDHQGSTVSITQTVHQWDWDRIDLPIRNYLILKGGML